MQISPISPLSNGDLCIFQCHSGATVAGAQRRLKRWPPPCQQKGSFQDITLQHVTFANLGITVWFWSSVSICDSFSLCLLAFRLPAIPAVHEHEANRVFSAAYLDTFVLDRIKHRCSPACPSYVLSRIHCFRSRSCVHWRGLTSSEILSGE